MTQLTQASDKGRQWIHNDEKKKKIKQGVDMSLFMYVRKTCTTISLRSRWSPEGNNETMIIVVVGHEMGPRDR